MNVVREIQKINEEELSRGIIGGQPGSWHAQTRRAAQAAHYEGRHVVREKRTGEDGHEARHLRLVQARA